MTGTIPTLRPYQVECLAEIDRLHRAGEHAQLVVLPTGTGKTVIFSELARSWAADNARVLILVHRDELVRQTVKKLTDAGLTVFQVGVVKAAENEVHKQVVVASVQTLASEARLKQFGLADLVIVDEAHHAPAPTYRRVIAAVEPSLLVGVTATPDRKTSSTMKLKTGRLVETKQAGMASVFTHLTYSMTTEDAIAAGYLADITGRRVQTQLDLSAVKSSQGDYSAGQLAAAVAKALVPEQLAAAYVEHGGGRPALAFLPDVATSLSAQRALTAAGVPAAHIDGSTRPEARQRVYELLRAGHLKVVTNCMVLTEGFDEPSVSCVLIGRPTQSRSLYAQMIGRGTRLSPATGKTDCLVIDLTANHHSLSLPPVTLVEYFQDKGWLDGQPRTKRTAQLAEDAAAAGPDVTPEMLAALRSTQIATDLWKKAPTMQLNWLRIGSLWHLRIGPGSEITVDDRFLVQVQGLRYQAASLAEAVGYSEQYANKFGIKTFTDTKAKWKTAKPSDKQLAFAKRLGIANADALTKGQLSDMIDARLAKR